MELKNTALPEQLWENDFLKRVGECVSVCYLPDFQMTRS
jgi:hypothetical protein